MESGPAKIAKALVFWLLPPACREEVLGDMRERNSSSAELLIEATHTVPSVIFSRIRRTTDAVLALMEVVSLYTAYVMSAKWLDHDLLFREYGFARLAIPSAIFLGAILLADAYADPKKRWLLRPLLGPALGFGLTYAMELNHGWALPARVLAWGGALGLVIISTLRMVFPPVTDRPLAVKVPAYWQKLELRPPSLRLRSVLWAGAVLVAILVFLWMNHS